jgi:hypothetical protein
MIENNIAVLSLVVGIIAFGATMLAIGLELGLAL